ncbi:hypothetical protein KFZ58_01530 [Virgibacillus sp. NKC19-16]|uniref:hypothetical protein n=1 Tax=Virgibacillus salidurans TaxID=2831673 RepID=UPI001F3431C4|nr:hypothetical protein [Virgibacillus sp. NKC19-16]UJL46669.1 hypothetical protein KFZ58_01530 [Virgibacillus sp. NKC19-16]
MDERLAILDERMKRREKSLEELLYMVEKKNKCLISINGKLDRIISKMDRTINSGNMLSENELSTAIQKQKSLLLKTGKGPTLTETEQNELSITLLIHIRLK